MSVRAKKHLGQHFLKDENIAKKIADTLTQENYKNVLEIGPGMGVLTKYLIDKDLDVIAMELDQESVTYLNEHYKNKNLKVIPADFLKFDLSNFFNGKSYAITGNFPYNISTQIVFKTLEWRDQIPEFTGMFQKEVAKRICEKEGSKAYGILSCFFGQIIGIIYFFALI